MTRIIKMGEELYGHYFCTGILRKGDFVYEVKTKKDTATTCKKISKKKHITSVIGMSLCDVVNIDMTKYHVNYHEEVPVGGRIRIMTHGDITIQIKPQKLKKLQPMYVQKDGTLGWRYSRVKAGCVIKDQDSEGFVVVRFAV